MGGGCPAPAVIRVVVAPGSLEAGAVVELDDEESHHLDVRRAEPGEVIEALDGAGALARGVLHRSGKAWRVAVEEVRRFPEPPVTVIALAAGDRDRFLLALEKLAELGVTRVIPLETARTANVASRYRDATREKGRRRLREACKQSGNPYLPSLDAAAPIAALHGVTSVARWFLADAEGSPGVPMDGVGGMGWIIGPEGGFTQAEREELVRSVGARAVALGRHTLRFETAAIAAASLTASLRDASTREGK